MFKKYFLKNRYLNFHLTVFLLIFISLSLSAREVNPRLDKEKNKGQNAFSTANSPVVYYAVHNRGNLQLAVANNGTFGSYGGVVTDVFTHEPVQSCIYPKNSNLVYMWVGALWIGAVVGRDTLVSCGTEDWYQVQEFWPNPNDSFKLLSIDESSPLYSKDAYSEEDFICTYYDTVTNTNLTNLDLDGAKHKPLNIKVTQRSMAWSYEYADDFILFDLQIENIGNQELEEVYMGIFIDGDAWHTTNNGPQGWNDDIVGFVKEFPAPEGHGFIDTVNFAYNADNDGDPTGGAWDERSVRSVVGTRVIRTPSDSLSYSFNWWRIDYGNAQQDFGPRKIGTLTDPFRKMGERLGTPVGDKNKYYVLKHKEFDYDLLFTAVDHTAEGYLPPPANADLYAYGFDTRYLLSFGPFNINPRERLPITFAIIGGEDLHNNPNAFKSHDPQNPHIFYDQLDFSKIAANSRWASWVYDNPGVDTDNNGTFGKFREICYDTTLVTIDTVIDNIDTTYSYYKYSRCDTSYYEGDGVPDFRGASPPPAPKFWIEPGVGEISVRFNGIRSETAKDQFSGDKDFEGYRVYVARDNLESSYSVIASYDIENYNKYVYDVNKLPDPGFVLFDIPYSLDSLQKLYGNPNNPSSFDPEFYGKTNNYIHPDFPDSIFYFVAQDYNTSLLGVNTDIVKTYPNQPYPTSLNPDSAQADELTEDGYFKYFEYNITIKNLLPTVEWWVNVTAFDFGSPAVGLAALESSLSLGGQAAYPLYEPKSIAQNNYDNIYVYPNPYRVDGNYRSMGLEGRTKRDLPDYRARQLHFVNIPPVCTIKIFSLDGDLIKEIKHETDIDDPEANHDEWDLITRNTQAVVSGLYYYVVEWNSGSFVGKFVIIM